MDTLRSLEGAYKIDTTKRELCMDILKEVKREEFDDEVDKFIKSKSLS